MKCPVCSKIMKEEDFEAVKVDVCGDGCKGIWFDCFELLKLKDKNPSLGKAFQEALNYPRANDENRGQLKCPKCGIPMQMHQYKYSKEINVDECYNCGGFFLDSGEFRQIKDGSLSEEERKEYARKLIDELHEIKEAASDLEKRRQRIKAIDNYTKFLRVSYYVTGK